MSDEQYIFQSLLKKVPVTSVKFFKNVLLAGIGGELCTFGPLDCTQLKSKVCVFDNSVIHGILHNVEKSRLCVFGGKHVAIVSVDFGSSNIRLRCTRKWRMADWVLCCQWLSNVNHLAVLSAHNELTLCDPGTGDTLASIACDEKCILYSATILEGEWIDTVVIAGTVFQQIIIWAVADNTPGERPVLHKLHGHKGVIFSVRFDERTRQILSTSDDRSIRVWTVVFPGAQRAATRDLWAAASVTLTFTLFGHTARVWQSFLLQDDRIVSIGEDSLLCVWSGGGRRECQSQRETHQGSGTWCLDVSESLGLVVTGGADGGISLWPLDPGGITCRSLPSPPFIPRRVALLKEGRVLITTEPGILALHHQGWSSVFSDSRTASYCLLELSPSRSFIGLATIDGHIIILRSTDFSKILDVQVCEGKRIFSLHWLDEDSILTCHDHGKLLVWKVCNSDLEAVGEVHLPACRERWTTSAVKCGDTVVFGDRAGNIHSSPLSKPPQHIEEVHTVRRAHSRLGVCSLSVWHGHVWSSGRDRTIKQFAIHDHRLILLSSTKLPVDWAAQILNTQLFGTIVVCFHESSVVVWSALERRKLVVLPCGGGHRSWSCAVESDTLYFTYLKDKTAHLLECSLMQIARPVIMDGFHTKEINSMAHIRSGWIASGGEDGSVRVSQVGDSSWSSVAVEHSHLSSVRAVHVLDLPHLSGTLLFSAGARAQLKVWSINFDSTVYLTELSSVMLREEKRGRHWLNNNSPVSDPETRFMDLHTLNLSPSTLTVLAACSDAFLRIFLFDLTKNEFSFNKSVRNSGHCILRVTSFKRDGGETVAVTGGTDGCITFWDTQADFVVFGCESVHQSGVNGLSVSKNGVGQEDVLVATGGDDNALTLSCFRIDNTHSLAVHKVASWTSSSLHSSAITGVEIVGEWVLCCGGDQRVTLLSWCVNGDNLSVQLLTQTCCSVPDIKGLSLVPAKEDKLLVCVYGVGVEILELNQKKR